MTFIMVDIEADGPIPGDYSMVSFGAVIVESCIAARIGRIAMAGKAMAVLVGRAPGLALIEVALVIGVRRRDRPVKVSHALKQGRSGAFCETAAGSRGGRLHGRGRRSIRTEPALNSLTASEHQSARRHCYHLDFHVLSPSPSRRLQPSMLR